MYSVKNKKCYILYVFSKMWNNFTQLHKFNHYSISPLCQKRKDIYKNIQTQTSISDDITLDRQHLPHGTFNIPVSSLWHLWASIFQAVQSMNSQQCFPLSEWFGPSFKQTAITIFVTFLILSSHSQSSAELQSLPAVDLRECRNKTLKTRWFPRRDLLD